MLHFDMNLYYVKPYPYVFSLALCIVFILSLYVCYSCYYNNFVSIFTLGYQLDEHYNSFYGCLPFCVRLVLSYCCLLSSWQNDDDDDDGS